MNNDKFRTIILGRMKLNIENVRARKMEAAGFNKVKQNDMK